MSSGRRITLALVALVLLAVVGYLVSNADHRGEQGAHRPVTSTSAPVTPSAPTRAGASG